MKKNILLAVASFIVTFAFLFQIANANENDDWPPRPRENPPAAGENSNDESRTAAKGATESNAKVPGIKCTDCEAHAIDVAVKKATNPKSSSGNAGTGSDTGTSRQGGTK